MKGHQRWARRHRNAQTPSSRLRFSTAAIANVDSPKNLGDEQKVDELISLVRVVRHVERELGSVMSIELVLRFPA